VSTNMDVKSKNSKKMGMERMEKRKKTEKRK
jgi:hypothetical protein